ncbi:hypothetical protein [Streptomyces sp. NPDC050560]|uniref:hypothetical protein n=1 Tax=Streptomyces sp. NPDC050560 TaxID=3365630 RepID=UPI003794A5B5
MTMGILVGLVVLVACGCACVVWASRGGPRWVRGVATVTLALGELVRYSSRQQRRRPGQSSGDD